jgi:hypothetical protein
MTLLRLASLILAVTLSLRALAPDGRGLLLLLLSLAACAPGRVTRERGCGARPPDEAMPPDGAELVKLAGGYELTLVNSEGGYGDSVVSGKLNLWPNDSVRRYAWVTRTIGRIPGERPLAGALETQSLTVPSYPNPWNVASPDSPAVELIGKTLYFGGIDAMDGSGERLRISSISQAGFWGTWAHEAGFEMTIDSATGRQARELGGYFCAVRLKDS